jgi:glycosyltransferase involved in cell wall biosynthesis
MTRCIVIGWDAHHNCIGRAHLIARAAALAFSEVQLIAFGFSHLGREVWAPLRGEPITVIPEPKTVAALIHRCRRVAAATDADVVIACKARLPSVLLGIAIAERNGARLIVDIDDHELAFIDPNDAPLSPLALQQQFPERLGEAPYSPFWTLAAQQLTKAADHIITCNSELQALHGGEIIAHLRDLEAFQSPQADPPAELLEIRRRCTPLVMFLGTPQRHKGLDVIAQAVAQVPGAGAAFIGRIPDRGIVNDITRAAGDQAAMIDSVAFAAMPACLALADAAVLLQDQSREASRYQLPAKACDALAAGIRLIATPTPPLQMLADWGFRGISFVESPAELPDAIRQLQPLSAADREVNQRLAHQHLSYASGATTMRHLLSQPSRRAISYAARSLIGLPEPGRRIILMLWKQNDAGVFGRRVDMVAKYLASRDDVDQVLLVEKPVSTLDLRKLEQSQNRHHRLLHRYAQRKKVGLLDKGKLAIRTPVMPAGLSVAEQGDFIERYCQGLVEQSLARFPGAKVGLWVYPYYRHAERIAAALPTDYVIADVVDDHRAWPNTSAERKTELTEHYRAILDLADMGIYNCRHTLQSIGRLSPTKAQVVANGVDFTGAPDAAEVADLREQLVAPGNFRGIIGYAGNLESKLDWPLVEHVAAKNPDDLVLLIGSTHVATQLPQRRNIRYVGPVPYDELRAYLATFDVAIIPHLKTNLTAAMNPLKCWVYATLGIPIISTDIPNLPEDLPQLKVTRSQGGFTKNVRRALNSGAEMEAEEILEIIRRHSWASRLESVVDWFHY